MDQSYVSNILQLVSKQKRPFRVTRCLVLDQAGYPGYLGQMVSTVHIMEMETSEGSLDDSV